MSALAVAPSVTAPAVVSSKNVISVLRLGPSRSLSGHYTESPVAAGGSGGMLVVWSPSLNISLHFLCSVLPNKPRRRLCSRC